MAASVAGTIVVLGDFRYRDNGDIDRSIWVYGNSDRLGVRVMDVGICIGVVFCRQWCQDVGLPSAAIAQCDMRK